MNNQQVCFVFPHQLFEKHPALSKSRPVYLIEETLFFNQYKFHKKKLLLHRASMQYYAQHLKDSGYIVHYVESTDKHSDVRNLIGYLAKEKKTESIVVTELADDWLSKRIHNACEKANIDLKTMPTPNFLNDDSSDNLIDKKGRYFHADFYTAVRKSKNILLEADGKPIGGKWSFDKENRKPFSKNQKVPSMGKVNANEYVEVARKWVEKHYPSNYGSLNEPLNDDVFFYPTTHEEAKQWISTFFKERFEKFGHYEDAMISNEAFLHHSVLSPLINIGLLDPKEVIDKAINHASDHDIPMNSLEGFVRQVIGWREFIHMVYEREGSKQRSKNFWNFKRKIPKSFWTGDTDIIPVDTVIKRILKYGYCHHIERLMVLGNFMLLCEFDPNEVYRWFMEMFVDSYDWVMVPNVYGMTQFADGGLMITKPYISGSNYVLKMGDWEKGEWQKIWDALFWRFMHQHRDVLEKNYRLGMLFTTLDNMNKDKRKSHFDTAAAYLQRLSSWR